MQTTANKTVFWITRTAVFLALLVAVQYFTRSFGQLVTGAAVNFVLVACALIAGLPAGLTVACISPFLAKLFGIGPLWSFVPLVALGNMAIVLVFSWILGRARRTNGFAKYALWIAAMTSLPAAKAEKLSAMFSVTQLFTALIGGVIAMLLVEPIRTAIGKNRS